MTTNKTERIQRNSISRDQAFDVYDALRLNISKTSNGTVAYADGYDDNRIAKATGVTDDAVKRIRVKRFGLLPDEMTSASARSAAKTNRLDVLEKKVERLIEWVNKVEGEINKNHLAEAAGRVEPVLFTD